MGLIDTIKTLETRQHYGQDVAQELTRAYAEMCVRKSSQNLMWYWFERLYRQLEDLGRIQELISAANGVDPVQIGWTDCQDAVQVWLTGQNDA